MTIDDFKGTCQASNAAELETILRKRYGSGVNGFWLSHDNERHPTVSLLVKGDLSTLLYVPRESHPGFIPVGCAEGLDRKENTTFSIDTIEQELEVSNEAVVRFSTAVSVAKDFFASKELPTSIEWMEL
jgi:hypothetical protein